MWSGDDGSSTRAGKITENSTVVESGIRDTEMYSEKLRFTSANISGKVSRTNQCVLGLPG